MLPISHAAGDIASRFCSSLAGRAEAGEVCEKIQSLLSADTQRPERMQLELEIQKRECQTLIFLLKDLEWTPGVQKTGIYGVKFCFQNTEHFLSIEYDSGHELLTICVDEHQSTEKLSIFNFASNLAGLLGISVNEVYFKLAGIESKNIISLFSVDQNQECLDIFGECVSRTRFDIKATAAADALWTECQNRFSMVWPSDGIELSGRSERTVASEFKNVAVTYILERYLTARHTHHTRFMDEPLREEVLDLGTILSPTIDFKRSFVFFDIPLCYFDKIYLSWPWRGKDCWPVTWGVCRDFSGLIVSAEMMIHHELNPFDGSSYFQSCQTILRLYMKTSGAFSHHWFNR